MSRRAGPVASSTEVTSKNSTNKWFGLVAVGIAGLLVWSMTAGSGDGSAISGEAGNELTEGAEQAETPDGDPETTVVERDEGVDEDAEEEVSPDTTGSSGSTGAATPAEDDLPDLTLLTEDGEPAVFDEPIGYALLVSGHGSSSVLDPDSQRLVELPDLGGDVILTTASHIVLASEYGPARSVSFDDLGAEPVGLDTGGSWPQLSVGPTEAQAWALNYDDEDGSQSRTLVDLDTGIAIRSYTVPVSVNPIGQGPSDLVNVIGGGVFEEIGGGEYRRFANGWALAATSELVLVRRCSGDLSCVGLWLDRQSGATLDYPSPDVQNINWWGASIDSSSTWYWTRDPRFDPSVGLSLAHIRTGRQVVLPGMEPWPGPSVSPDGRWATYLDQRLGQINLVNLESGLIYHVADLFRGSQVTFVPLESMDSVTE